MLSDSELLLLTAAVDGDLTREQAKAVRRLVGEKPEAARLFRRLRADAKRVRTLTPRIAPPDLRAAVMARIPAATPTPTATPARRPTRPSAWVPYVVAASLLFAVAAGSFFFFRPNTPPNEHALRIQLPVETPRGGDPVEVPDPNYAGLAKPGESDDPTPGRVKAAATAEQFATATKSGPEIEVIPAPRDVVVQAVPPVEPKDVFTVGEWIASKPLTAADLRLPTLVNATEFHQADVSARVRKEFGHDTAVRVDLFSKTPAVAIEHLQAVARARGVNVFVDAATADRMRKPLGLTYAVYLENLSADELAALFAALSKQVNANPKPEAVLGAAHFIPAGSAENKDVKDLIGIDLAVLKVAKPAADEPKPISSGTLPMVAAAVKKSEKAAVVVTYLPANARVGAAKSNEVKQFLDKRGDRKPGTVPVLVVIRS